MTYVLGQKSIANMAGVHPDLRRVVGRAIGLSRQDFGVRDRQVRTLDEQRRLVAGGTSQTLRSNHLEQVDLTDRTRHVYGHAVDLVPWENGAWSWDWGLVYPVAEAMSRAASLEGLSGKLCWGGVWDRWMSDYSPDAVLIEAEVALYSARTKARKRAQGLKPTVFVDGPHFQLYRKG